MKEIKIKDKEIRTRFRSILLEHWKKLSKSDLDFIKLIILRFKEHSHNEYPLLIILIYWFFYYDALSLDDELVEVKDRDFILKILKSYRADVEWDFKTYIFEMLSYDEDLFLIKVIIKYTLLNWDWKWLALLSLWNLENYFKSIWYLIPVLTYRDSSFLSFFQDFYFKKLYPVEYEKTRSRFLKETSKFELPWLYIINKINNLSNLMKILWVYWIITIRKKSYFSLYAKYNKQEWKKVDDYLWIRIVFNNLSSLNKFRSAFEADHVLLAKDDYIKKPKENWYRAIHYSYLTAFRNSQILVELQIKTMQMEKEIENSKSLSHFAYTIKKNKWDPLFKEVHKWYKLLKEYLEESKK